MFGADISISVISGMYRVSVSSASGAPALTTAGFQVLLALASGRSHGYAVMGFVDQLTDGRVRLGPGTLYRTLARLVADELVSESGATDPTAPHDARRRYYELTPLGAQVVREEAEMLARLVEAANNAGLLDRSRRTR
jgi:DNA-binding PadR family transcriptional regulator